MNSCCLRNRTRRRANALLMVLVLASAALIILCAILGWAQTNGNMTARNQQNFRAMAAAEAATEKIIARVGNDYQNYGVALVNANLDSYRNTVPTGSEYDYWSNFEFKDTSGVAGRTTVDWLPVTQNTVLSSKYTGLRGFGYDMHITALAREVNSPFNIVGRNQQELALTLVPIFQYAIFYNNDLEIEPAPPMVISGPVHCNANIYCVPVNSLDFMDQVTAAGKILTVQKPGDPSIRTLGRITFHTLRHEGVPTLNLPLGTNNSSAAVHQVLEIPPLSEPPSSLLGQLRYYNLADLVVLVSNSAVRVTSGAFNNFATDIPWSQATNFVKTNASFYDFRQAKTITCTDIDINQLRLWNATNTVLSPLLSTLNVRTVYVGDVRTPSATTLLAVRLINGHWLPPQGLTVATFNPMYIQGHYNVTTNGTVANLGTANTTQTVPASVAADALGILSPAWSDVNSALAIGTRKASDTTVNAAILVGNSETVRGYGGGVENFPRFLEDWSGGRIFTFNTSLVCMFPSQIATGPWGLAQVYSPPNRNWSFDKNFNDPTKLPPATPQVRLLVRGSWSD